MDYYILYLTLGGFFSVGSIGGGLVLLLGAPLAGGIGGGFQILLGVLGLLSSLDLCGLLLGLGLLLGVVGGHPGSEEMKLESLGRPGVKSDPSFRKKRDFLSLIFPLSFSF